jgi:hypothetical protein
MEDVLAVYARPYDPDQPVLCFDEKSKELRSDSRMGLPAKEGCVRRRDYEYVRNGTANIFMTVEPKGGYRTALVTTRRTRTDFAHEIRRIIQLPRYKNATTIHIVLDNLNTHFEKSLTDTFEEKETSTIMRRIKFHHTPKHASWLNMAETELSIMERQCTRGRISDDTALREKLRAWQRDRNAARATINWKFTRKDAQNVFNKQGAGLS